MSAPSGNAALSGQHERRVRLALNVAIVLGGVSCIGGLVLLVIGVFVGTATFGIHLLGSENPCTGTDAAGAVTKLGFMLLVGGPVLGWIGAPALARWGRRRRGLAWTIAGTCLLAVALLAVILATTRSCR